MITADELVVLTRAEYEALTRRAAGAAVPTETFSAEEMQAIRDQYEERIAVAEERREELEWRLRLELAKIRDAELSARRAADEMRRVEQTLAALVADTDDTEVRPTVPSPTLHPVAPRPQAAQVVRKPVPPPIPAAPLGPPRHANGANGQTNGHGSNGMSHAEKFRAAMAKRGVA